MAMLIGLLDALRYRSRILHMLLSRIGVLLLGLWREYDACYAYGVLLLCYGLSVLVGLG